MGAYAYELVGGDAALDFLNTIHDWFVQEAERVDRLETYPDAVMFGAAAGVLSVTEARHPSVGRAAGTELAQLHELRARLERIFGALVEGRSPATADLDRLGRDAAAAATHARLQHARGRVVRRIDGADAGLATLRVRLAEAATTLLLSPRWERVKRCPRCGWFFLDLSKNGSRRWCSMAMCGTATKAQTYYRRSRKRRADAPLRARARR